MLKESRQWLGLDDRHFRDAVSASLEILGADALQAIDPTQAAQEPATAHWEIPTLDQRFGADPTWAATLDTLRSPRQRNQKLWDWRREAPIRPVVFRDPGSLDGDVVHLHLEHRVVQRLLARFLAQGFLHDELTRACVCLTDDPIPKVIVLGRLSLYGDRASRLHMGGASCRCAQRDQYLQRRQRKSKNAAGKCGKELSRQHCFRNGIHV